MTFFHFILLGLISFWPLSTTSKIEESKTFLKENTVQYEQHIYGIDNENKVWEGNVKDKKDSTDNIIVPHAHPILSQKEIVSIFSDVQGKPVFEDKEGIFYYEDGNVIIDPVLRGQTSADQVSSANGPDQPKITFSALDENKNIILAATETSPIPTDWQLKYFGYIGVDPDAPAPNGSGLTILQCYLQGVDPMPEEAISMTVSATGPFRAPANVTLVASITHPANVKVSHIDFFYGTLCLGSATTEPYQVTPVQTFSADHWTIQAKAYDTTEHEIATATAQFDVLPSNRYYRGHLPDIWNLADLNYLSSIIALDSQCGVQLDGITNTSSTNFDNLYTGASYPWFLRTCSDLKEPCNHVIKVNGQIDYLPVNVIPTIAGVRVGDQPPMMAFGSQARRGATPLYINQTYHFGIAAGGERPDIPNNLKIEVYDKDPFVSGASNIAAVLTTNYTLPCSSNPSDWNNFQTNQFTRDYHLLTNCNGKTLDFDTQITYETLGALDTWGQSGKYNFVLTHKAANDSFYYKVSFMGAGCTPSDPTLFDMARDAAKTAPAYNLSYSLDFESPLPWRSVLIDQPHFQGIPLPNEYQGKSLDELIHQSSQVVDTLPPPEQIGLDLVNINKSSELKSHPKLDKLVDDLDDDPYRIANYVLNQIELTDAVGYNITASEANLDPTSINPQGISRDALATYLERQGSPIEQCALLIYLLRKAGYPAAYVFPNHNTTLMFDQPLSKMLKIQLRGTMSFLENAAEPELIPINYPWVVFYDHKDQKKWIHLFPWIKNTKVIEGKNLWDYFPYGYNDGKQWLLKYLCNDPAVRNPLGTTDPAILREDNIGTLFPLYAAKQLASNNLAIGDIGIQFTNQPCNYESWDDFPRPWQTAPVTSDRLAQSLEVDQNPNLSQDAKDQLADIFDTIEVTVISDREGKGNADAKYHKDKGDPVIETGPLRLANLHDRTLLLHHEVVAGTNSSVQYKMILSLDPYDANEGSNDTETYTFYSGDHPNPSLDQLLRNKQKVSSKEVLDDQDKNILYHVCYRHHQQMINKAPPGYREQFPGICEKTIIDDSPNQLFKGDMACLSLFYGRVTPEMMDFQAQKFNQCREALTKDPDSIEKQNAIKGQYLAIVGQSYYQMVGESQQMLECMTKTHAISYTAHGLSKLSPTRDSNNQIVLITNTNTQTQDLDLVYPNVDMSFQILAHVDNESSHLDSGDSSQPAFDTALELITGEGSADEHRVINKLYNQENAISTVKLLDIAQGWTSETGLATNGGTGAGAVVLTANNYIEEGGKPYGCKKTADDTFTTNSLADWNNHLTGWWTNVVINTLSNAQENLIIMTPGPVTAKGQQGGMPYTGVGAMILTPSSAAGLITGRATINGGYGAPTHQFENGGASINVPATTIGSTVTIPDYKIDTTPPPSDVSPNPVTVNPFGPGGQYDLLHRIGINSPPPGNPSDLSQPTQSSQPSDLSQPTQSSQPSDLPTPSAAPTNSTHDQAPIGFPVFYGKLKTFVMDPVSVATGEFYINALDLKLNGPMPLEIRRIYSSQSTVNENLGHGWRLSYFSYLTLSNDSETTPSLIQAAEMDGSVIAYRYNADQKIWIPLPSDNPTLINENDTTTLASKNLFNNCITQTTDNGLITYTLTGADGSQRTFKVHPELTHQRPYLDRWNDNQGNFYQFFFGQNKKSSDYEQLIRINSSNGNSVRFNYDTTGHIVEAFSNDGQFLKYSYDGNGDLVKITLPDASTISYSYSIHNIDADSYHLLTQEIKPGGRILKNSYDQQCRVISQYATTGTSPTPTLSGTFAYHITAANPDSTIEGTTTLTDSTGNTTTYTISHNQIATITAPQNKVTTQTWNFSDTSRSLASVTDPLGLKTTYQYDNQGNVTSRSVTGKITGNGSNETATTQFRYNNLHCLSSSTDAIGNITSYTYGNSSLPYNPTSIVTTASSGQTINSVQIDYTQAGGACGLVSNINNNGAITAYTYEKHGFPNSVVKKTGTGDPDMIATLSCDMRGNIVTATDTLGQKRTYYYDLFNRPTGFEIYDATGARIDWHFNYYNYNGEIEWEQGARLNPADYTSYNYDRAGHLLQKSTYLTAGALSWAGLAVGNAGLATTSYNYDAQGNCTLMVDPNGNKTTMDYDTLGEMTSRIFANGAKESFAYDSGGNMVTHTTLLGATESFTYTSTGLLQSASRANGTTTNYRYDLIGRLVQEMPSTGPTCDISYNGHTITRTFSSSGKSLGSTSESYDGRGNLLGKTDIAGNQWSYSYDGLNRIKTEQGPPSSGNSAQQSVTHYYALNFESLLNGAGEWINRSLDAVGRPILTTSYNKDGSVAQNISNHYSGDHQSVETTVGTGNNAITTTTYSDTQGRPLTIKNADGTFKQFSYDANGNLTLSVDEEGIGSAYTYDALNHLASQTILPDGTYIAYNYDATGNLLTRTMPESLTEQKSLTEQNSYNTAGEKTASSLIGSDGATTRNYTYQYQNGLLASIADPRGFTTTITYDDWQRPTNLTSSGSSIPQQNQTTTYTYDPRGLITSVEQHYNDSSTGPSTLVSRAYDAYGQLTSETTSLNGNPLSSWSQTWDEAGRRTALNWNLDQTTPGTEYAFSYNALGEMTGAQNGSGTYSYGYGNNGLLVKRTTPSGTTSFTRDGRGRITDLSNTINGTIALAEHLDWTTGNRIASYNVVNGFPQESRNYDYFGTKLFHEPFLMTYALNQNFRPNSTQTSLTLFDEPSLLSANVSTRRDGIGVRTTQFIGDRSNRVAAQDNFTRVTQSITSLFGSNYNYTFSYDNVGNTITGSSLSDSLQKQVDQQFTWDSFNRLVSIEQKSNITEPSYTTRWGDSFAWKTAYDGLGRRIQTESGGSTINYYYDPEVEFLELGHSVNGTRIWNLYGPDRSGVYGGAQGIGGLESTFDEHSNTTKQWVNNYFGDALGWHDPSSYQSFSVPLLTLGAYGPMLGSPIPKTSDPQWRGHYIDDTGLYYMGTRYYDPVNGRFISPDPLGHSSSLSLYDYCNGDPVNGLDPDGRCVEGTAKGYTLGTFAEYGNTAQAVGGFVGTLGSYATPGLGEAAFARDVAGSAWHGLQALGDMYNNGLNWRNGTTLGLSALGVGAGAVAALVPTKAAVEAAASIEESYVSSFPAGYQGGPGAMWKGEVNQLSEELNPSVFRQGTFADESVGWKGNLIKGKQWSAENPLTTPNYAKKYGLPEENTGNPDWIVGGRIQGGYTTRQAPPSHNNPVNTGGGKEILPNNPNDVFLDFFHMP
ncbi:MAG: RHS repeat-associated core domain-containing protein [Alphaproteobacteria bacterium]|nr:RHS repeat-associated core domain-containing protein [Alphaproteobacteria bacterium]